MFSLVLKKKKYCNLFLIKEILQLVPYKKIWQLVPYKRKDTDILVIESTHDYFKYYISFLHGFH